ncbi:copper amine oxidase N-terminal domain-containing protein [Butyricicoccus sp. OF27-2pH9A]|uniref:copper amine oxidase N-terminal domain-containing protein n=1 Tax=Butyricicoccus sp. OF27-2pH9A TaxID=3002517 RepID=UPI0022E863F8|nr:copper amine oxidase N-terminal domain-containing protein [Butyricicoccus sp. OF27-2pH9A]
MKKRIPAIILMFALFLTTSYAANTYRKTIAVTSGVNVEFNNEAIDMTDANGKAVEAFIYNGTTYVPIRAVSNAFGADIGYDRNTQTISVYDDFTEILIAAYKLDCTISVCMTELEVYRAAINNNAFWTAPAEKSKEAQAFIDRDTEMLKTLSEDNGCYHLLSEQLLPTYNEFIKSYQQAVKSYAVMYNQRNYSDEKLWTPFAENETSARENSGMYASDLEIFYDSFNWRTFDADMSF